MTEDKKQPPQSNLDKLTALGNANAAAMTKLGVLLQPAVALERRIELLVELMLGDLPHSSARVKYELRYQQWVESELKGAEGQLRQAKLAAPLAGGGAPEQRLIIPGR